VAPLATTAPGQLGRPTSPPDERQKVPRTPLLLSLSPAIVVPSFEAPALPLVSPPPERWPVAEIDVPPPVQRAPSR
jgi:hypothetical protein